LADRATGLGSTGAETQDLSARDGEVVTRTGRCRLRVGGQHAEADLVGGRRAQRVEDAFLDGLQRAVLRLAGLGIHTRKLVAEQREDRDVPVERAISAL